MRRTSPSLRCFAAGVTLFIAFASSPRAATFRLTNLADSGTGSLRWAIEQANATAGRDTILPMVCYGANCAIQLRGQLPAVTESVTISGVSIDGSAAGDADGLVIQADHVTIESVTVANFRGDGIVVQAASDYFEFVRSINNRNGIRLESVDTGVYGCEFRSNRQTGIWLKASATDNRIGRPPQGCAVLCPPWAGPNGVFASGGNGILVDGSDNIIDSNNVGTQSSPNGGSGIVVVGDHNVITANALRYNNGCGIYLATPARVDYNWGGCNVGELFGGVVTPAPVISSVRADPTVISAIGTVRGSPNAPYLVTLHAVPDCTGANQAITPIASAATATDSSGIGHWSITAAHAPVAAVFAVASSTPLEETSAASVAHTTVVTNETRADLAMTTAVDPSASSGREVELVTTVRNNGPAAIDAFAVSIPLPPGMASVSASTTSGYCYLNALLRSCRGSVLAAGATATIRERLRATTAAGQIRYTATVSLFNYSDMVDPYSPNNVAATTVDVLPGSVPMISRALLLLLATSLAAIGILTQRT